MTDDDKHPDYDNEPIPTPRKISDLYDAAVKLLDDLFPRDQIDTLHALTGIPVRSITRYRSAQQRIAPTLLEKLHNQSRLKGDFIAEFEALLAKHSETGLLHEVMRQGILSEINGDFFKNEETL